MAWTRDNADRLLLVAAGAALVVVAVLLRERQAFASTLAVVGFGAIVVGILRPRLRSFSVGPKGVDAQLDRIEKKVDEIARSGEVRKALAELVADGRSRTPSRSPATQSLRTCGRSVSRRTTSGSGTPPLLGSTG